MNVATSDEQWQIDTPENVIFDYQVAGIGSRFLAAFVDTILIVLLIIGVYALLFLLIRSLGLDSASPESHIIEWMVALAGLAAFACLWGYYIFFEMAWNGQSPGKRWVGLRVIRTDGTPITLTESLVRNLVRVIDFLPAYYGVGVIAMFINEQSRRLGDLAAGTLVVRDRVNIPLEALTPRPALPRTGEGPSIQLAWPVERLTAQDIQMAEDFLRRRSDLSGRSMVAQRIARALLKRMDLPADGTFSSLPVEDLIAAIVKTRASLEE